VAPPLPVYWPPPCQNAGPTQFFSTEKAKALVDPHGRWSAPIRTSGQSLHGSYTHVTLWLTLCAAASRPPHAAPAPQRPSLAAPLVALLPAGCRSALERLAAAWRTRARGGTQLP
jgi:hypothetical protein